MSEKQKIADVHTHIFPEKIAEKATRSIGDFYNIPMKNPAGSSLNLLKSGAKIGVSKYLVCSVATAPKQVESINTFIHGECAAHPEFLGFAALHQDYESYEAEIDRILGLGLKGVKFHPDFQEFNIDDEAVFPMYRRIAAARLPVLFHMGDDRYTYSAPKRLHKVVQEIPDLICIAAHFGGYRCWDKAVKYLKYDNIFFDTSSSLFALTNSDAAALIHEFGVTKFMFGTDFPMWDHATELERFLGVGLCEGENELILYKNFERLFGVAV